MPKEIKAQKFGEVTLIHAVSVKEAKRLVEKDFTDSGLKLEVFEELDTNLYFCSTENRTRSESRYVFVVLDSTKYLSKGN